MNKKSRHAKAECTHVKPITNPSASSHNSSRVSLGERLLREPIGLAGVAIALVTLGVMVYQGGQSASQHRLGFRPRITFIEDLDQSSEFIGRLFTNAGVGPAVIEWMRVFVDVKGDGQSWLVYTGKGADADMREARSRLGLADASAWLRLGGVDPGATVRVGAEVRLFGFPKSDFTPDRFEIIRLVDRRLQIRLCYCSLYLDECWMVPASDDRIRSCRDSDPLAVMPTSFKFSVPLRFADGSTASEFLLPPLNPRTPQAPLLPGQQALQRAADGTLRNQTSTTPAPAARPLGDSH